MSEDARDTNFPQVEMYGCTESAIDKAIEQSHILAGPNMLALQILSDAQELLRAGDEAQANRLINRAKYVIYRSGL